MSKNSFTTERLRRHSVLALAFLSLPFVAAASEGPAPDGALAPVIGPVLKPGQHMYRIDDAGQIRTFIVDGPDSSNVIVQLRGAPLASQSRGPAGRASAAARQSTASAAERLDAQHERVHEAITALASGRVAARASVEPAVRVRFDYRNAFNGLALTAPRWLIDELRANPEVERIRPDITMKADLAQSVPLIGAAELQAQGLTGRGVVVGIIDTGVDYRHPALGGGIGPGFRVIGGHDFVNDDDDPLDDHGHGTHVAGIVAASGPLTGVAPGASLVAYKVLNQFGSGSASTIIAAIDRATDPDGDPTTDDALDIINLSLGSDSGDPDDPVCQAIDAAAEAGVLPVIAAGNAGPNYLTVGSPGMARRALTVGSSTKTDTLSAFSSRGPSVRIDGLKPDVLAPGDPIVSTWPGGGTRSLSGTSMAAPHVAGAAALLLEARPRLSPDALKSLLMTTAHDLGLSVFAQGTGRIDVAAAARRRTIVTPAAVSFGRDDTTQPTFDRSTTVTVTNTGATSRHYAASVVNRGLPAGIAVSVAPTELDLAPGASATLAVLLHVDNAAVPSSPTETGEYVWRVRLASTEETLQIPFAFLKGALLRISFDAIPDLVFARNADGRVWSVFFPEDTHVDLLVPPGIYEVHMAHFGPSPTLGRWRDSLVSRRNIPVQEITPIELRLADASNVLSPMPLDEHGQTPFLLLEESVLRLPGPRDFTFTSSSGQPNQVNRLVEFAYSPLDASVRLDWLLQAHAPGSTKFYSYFWHRAGISASEALTNEPAELTPLEFRLDAEPNTPPLLLGPWDVQILPSRAVSFGFAVALEAPYAWTHFVMPRPAGSPLFGLVKHEVMTTRPDGSSDVLYSVPPMQAGRGITTVHAFAFPRGGGLPAPLDTTPQTKFDVGLEPYSWTGRFDIGPESLFVDSALGGRGRLFAGQMMDQRGVRSTPYELLQGTTVVQRGELPGDSSLQFIRFTPGRYTVQLHGPAGSLAGHPTATTVKATFDADAPMDPNPPTLTHFRILAGGKPSKAFCIGEKAEIRFRVTDDFGLRDVKLAFRIGTQGLWLPWPLDRDGEDVVARLPLGAGASVCAGGATLPVPISVRIQATDTHGNVLDTEMAPAYARLIPIGRAMPFRVDTP